MSSLSLFIIAKNEAQLLESMLTCVKPLTAQIVVVVDAQSTDDTEVVARRFGAEVYVEEWKGLVAQKQSALDRCAQPWVLSLDCDEVPDAELLSSIAQVVQADDPCAAIVKRRTHYLGRALRYAWQPDRHLRLAHRSLNPHVVSVNGHDEIKCDADSPRTLAGWLDHYSYRSIAHHMEKTLFYARIGAQDYYERGRRFSLLNLIVNPLIAFIKLTIIRRAFLDGVPGLIAGCSTFIHVFLKYAMLWELERTRRNELKR